MRTRLPRAGQNVIVVLVSLFVALLLAELVLRIFAPQYLRLHVHPTNVIRDRFINHDRLGLYDQLLGWKFQPSAIGENRGKEFRHEIRTNSRGYRDDETEPERRPGVRRVLLLGDSFGMGWGVRREEMLATLLEEELASTEVVNLSVAGYGTDQEVLTYETEGERYEADVVILLFVVANDVENNFRMSQRYRKPYFLPEGEGLALHGVPVPFRAIESRKVPVAPSPFPVHDWLNANSAFYALLFDRLASVSWLRDRWEASGLLHRQVAVFGSGDLDVLRREPGPEWETGWSITERLLERWHDEAKRRGETPVLVLVPSHLQVDPDVWERAVRESSLDPGDFDLEAPNRRLVELGRRRGLAVLDLLPHLRDAVSSSLPLYYRQDPHWTPEGHRVAARAVARYLEELTP